MYGFEICISHETGSLLSGKRGKYRCTFQLLGIVISLFSRIISNWGKTEMTIKHTTIYIYRYTHIDSIYIHIYTYLSPLQGVFFSQLQSFEHFLVQVESVEAPSLVLMPKETFFVSYRSSKDSWNIYSLEV